MVKRWLAGAVFVALIGLILGVRLVNPASAQVFSGSNWQGQYYANPGFTGTPNTVRTDNVISFNYGPGAPAGTTLPVDNFSIRWTTTQNFAAGTYTFTAFGEDDVRVVVNGGEIIPFRFQDNAAPQTFTATTTVPAGNVTIVVEFVARTGNASIQFQWQLVGGGGTAAPTASPTRTALPGIPPGALTATVIRASVLNTRDAPSLGGNRLGRILRGETYAVIGRDERARWFLLQLGGYQAWAWGYYLFINGNEFNAPVRSPFGTLGVPPGVTDTGVVAQAQSTMRLRAQPNVASAQIGRITWGGFLPVVGRSADGFWWQVVWKGTVGWMYSPFSRIIQGDLNSVPVR
jgi:hypothetical protein